MEIPSCWCSFPAVCGRTRGETLKMYKRNKNKGFTLVEIMIVVLIIGILLAIAVPNFIKARQNSRLQSVIGNLKQIDSAKQQWAMDLGKTSTDTPVDGQGGDLAPAYMNKWPVGPVGVAADYVANAVNADPTFKGITLTAFQDPATQAASIAAAGL